MFRAESDQMVEYEAVAIIEYQGNLDSQGDSAGHYICDVKDKVTECWFRTNDNMIPIQVQVDSVSDMAYVILYRKLN